MAQAQVGSDPPAPEISFADEGLPLAELVLPMGNLCHACGTPLDVDDHFCPSCGATQSVAPAGPIESALKHIRCQSCGSEIETQQEQQSYVCPFCESTYVLEVPPSDDQPQVEFVIGFAVTPEVAEKKFKQWIADNSWFRPSDLALARPTERLRGVYLPFWHFAMLAHSQWHANIGEYWYRTETYTTRGPDGKTQTKTRRVRETEWWPLQGYHHRYYSGHLVSAASGLSQLEANSVMPFQLEALKRYDPSYLAGWQAEAATVMRSEALPISHQYFAQQEERNVAGFLPGDTYQGLNVSTSFSSETSDLCLLPIYLMNYRYQDQIYRFIINGRTGKIAGQKPYSKTRLAIFIVVILILIALVIGLFFGIAALQRG